MGDVISLVVRVKVKHVEVVILRNGLLQVVRKVVVFSAVDINAIGKGSEVNINKDLNIAQSFAASVNCMSSTENMADLKQKIQAAAEQVAKNQLESASSFFNVNISTNVSKVKQIVETNFNFSDIQDCSTNIAQKANIIAEGGGKVNIGGGVNIQQEARTVVECIKQSKMVSTISTEMANMVSQEIENSSLSWFSYIIMFVLIIAIIIAGVTIYKYSQGSNNEQMYNQQMYGEQMYDEQGYGEQMYDEQVYV